MPLEQSIISSASGEFCRSVWYRAGPKDRPHTLCVFLDGEHYVRDMDALPILDELMARGAIPEVSLLFVSHVSSDPVQADYNNDRERDYACNDRYARFIAEEVTGWARILNPGILPRGNLIGGLSLSGLASAYGVFRHPEVFSSALCQSGSFWWLAGKEVAWPATKARFWLSVGDEETAAGVTHSNGMHQEISQIDGVRNAAQKFTALGGAVNYHLFHGGHAMAPWKAELAQALPWLLGPSGHPS